MRNETAFNQRYEKQNREENGMSRHSAYAAGSNCYSTTDYLLHMKKLADDSFASHIRINILIV